MTAKFKNQISKVKMTNQNSKFFGDLNCVILHARKKIATFNQEIYPQREGTD